MQLNGLQLIGVSTMIVAMMITWLATPFVIRLAGWINAVDHPNARKAHSAPMPRIGGLAVFLGFTGSLAFAAWAAGVLFIVPENAVYWRGLAIAGSFMMLIGLVDDIRGLRFYWKFLAQFAAAIYVWSCGFSVEILSSPVGGDAIELGWLSFPVTLLWIVGITNAVNLIDGLDGLASGIALITTLSVAGIAFYRGELGVTAASVALAGALIGFLRFNFNPARIFLGDSGSMFLGFVLAVTSVRGSQKGPTVVAVLVPLLVLGLPLLDTSMAIGRRLWRLSARGAQSPNRLLYVARNINQVFLPDRGHIHHRLMDVGMSHRNAVLTLYMVGGAMALMAFALVLVKSLWVAALLFLLLVVSMAAFLVILYFRRVPKTELAKDESPRAESSASPREPMAASSGNSLRR